MKEDITSKDVLIWINRNTGVIYLVLIVVLLILLGFIIYALLNTNTEGIACISDPMGYAFNHTRLVP